MSQAYSVKWILRVYLLSTPEQTRLVKGLYFIHQYKHALIRRLMRNNNSMNKSPNALCRAKLVFQVHTRNMHRSIHILHKRFFSPVKEINSLFTNSSKITHNYVSIYLIISRLIWLFFFLLWTSTFQALLCMNSRLYSVWIPDQHLWQDQVSKESFSKSISGLQFPLS